MLNFKIESLKNGEEMLLAFHVFQTSNIANILYFYEPETFQMFVAFLANVGHSLGSESLTSDLHTLLTE